MMKKTKATQKIEKDLFFVIWVFFIHCFFKDREPKSKSEGYLIVVGWLSRTLPLLRSGSVILASQVILNLTFLIYKMELIPPTAQVLGNIEGNA